jgi:hypothetical protein
VSTPLSAAISFIAKRSAVLYQILKFYLPVKMRHLLVKIFNRPVIEQFRYRNDIPPQVDIIQKFGPCGGLVDSFVELSGYPVHKWHHYLPIYDRYLNRYKNKDVKVLEIGVSGGGSLKMWREYFGKSAKIYGVDVNPYCITLNGIHGQVRIGNSNDPLFLKSVLDEMGGIDIVIDDGSHQMEHVRNSLFFLFPRLNSGGTYIIEDLHCAFKKKYGGGYFAKSNFFKLVSKIIYDLHHWYHSHNLHFSGLSEYVSAIHIHDSVVVFEKDQIYPPVHSNIM